MSMRLVLASASPRRARLLTEAGIAFEAWPTDVDERAGMHASAERAVEQIALLKARAVDAPGAWVLAADTIVEHGGRVIGKPQDEADAHAILRLLSGDTHRVLTGVAVRAPDGTERIAHAITRVTFRDIGDHEIDAYLRTGEPMDKAGAYGIQGGGAKFVTRVDGPIDSVVGLPIGLVRRLLSESGFSS